MNNSVGGNNTDAGAGACGARIQTASAQFEEDDWVQLTEKGRKMVADGMAASIVRISRELEEAQAQIAIYEVERGILEKEMRRLREEVAKNRVMRLDWRDCAKRLAAAVQYYHPELRDETDGAWSEERAAIALFDELEAAE